ncbi:MAG: microviridin/marinostatin family tricyclic proteinase inhibitor [Phycisphaerales bacterium]|nr:microviridin/marinostatin family tricyclic proteinase inhibitor [Phycisphaerales bacterium]
MNTRKSDDTQAPKEVPFFARYLEDQRLLKVKTGLKAGPELPPLVTLKFPSDDAPEIVISFP